MFFANERTRYEACDSSSFKSSSVPSHESSSSPSDYSGLKASSSSESSSSNSDNQADGSSASRMARRRRPSHRPRGCRGGKRNKKKLQGLVQQQQQHFETESSDTIPSLATVSSARETTCNIFASMARDHVGRTHGDVNNSAASLHYIGGSEVEHLLPCKILPPPILKEVDPPLLNGPNPYALTPSRVDDQHYANAPTSSEKPRMLLPEGGSLFLVSPRSFLFSGAGSRQHMLWCS